MFEGMMNFLATLFGGVFKGLLLTVEWFQGGIEFVWESIGKAWLWLKGILLELWSEVLPYIMNALPEGARERIEGIPWAEVVSAWSDVAWIIPLEESLAIISATFTVVGVIRLIRHIIGWVPTIEG
jgi:hypothetical protein